MTPLLATRPPTDRAFERMYQRHVRDVYRYALVVLSSPEDAEDVTQTTFMNAYRAYQRGERPRAAQNWLIAIAHNVCRQRFRQASRRPQQVEFDDTVDHAVPDDDGPTAHDIRRALDHLAFNQRAALVMREIEGRSYPEIAEVLGLSVGAVETLVFRARRALREQLEGALTCHEAEQAISQQLDGRLPRAEKGALRAHLRECADCAGFARSQRAQRSALRSFAMVPLPTSLASFFGGSSVGGGLLAGGLAAKGAATLAAGIVATGVSYEGAKQAGWTEKAKPKAAQGALSRPADTGRRTKPVVTGWQSGTPGFERNSVKPGQRVGPREPVRSRIIARKRAQAARKAARIAARNAARREARARARPGRRPVVPPGRARVRARGAPANPAQPRSVPPGLQKKLPIVPPQPPRPSEKAKKK